jgi:hypothetical protein
VTRRDITLMRPSSLLGLCVVQLVIHHHPMMPTLKVSRRHRCIRRRKTKSPWAGPSNSRYTPGMAKSRQDLLETLEATKKQLNYKLCALDGDRGPYNTVICMPNYLGR